MAIDQKLHDRIKAIARELRQEAYGASGAPIRGRKSRKLKTWG